MGEVGGKSNPSRSYARSRIGREIIGGCSISLRCLGYLRGSLVSLGEIARCHLLKRWKTLKRIRWVLHGLNTSHIGKGGSGIRSRWDKWERENSSTLRVSRVCKTRRRLYFLFFVLFFFLFLFLLLLLFFLFFGHNFDGIFHYFVTRIITHRLIRIRIRTAGCLSMFPRRHLHFRHNYVVVR